MSSEWPADVLDWIELVLHLLLRLVASATVTGMMEIRSEAGHHKHPDEDPIQDSQQKRKGERRGLPSGQRASREFPQQRITVASAHTMLVWTKQRLKANGILKYPRAATLFAGP